MNNPSSAPRLAADVTRTVLPNGLTVLLKENHNAPVAALFVLVRAGYFQEPDRVNGIAHVIEHMIFKGTPARPEDEQFAREIRELGGLLNASTYYEETSYYVVVPSEQLEKAMEIQADAVQNARIDPTDLAKELEVIVQESLQKRDNPNAMLLETLYELAHDRHRIRRWRIGHPQTLRSLTREDLLGFMQQTYRPENIIFAIVGDIHATQAMQWAHRCWGDMPRGEALREQSPSELPHHGFRYRRMVGETRQRLLALTVPAPALLDPDTPALMVLSAILSDGRSARLYRRLKEELQIANSAWSSYEGFEAHGLFTLGAECVGDDPLPVVQALWAEALRCTRDAVSDEEIERIKVRIESRRLYSQEEVLGVARTLASYESLGDYHLSDTFLERLRAVTIEDVQRVAGAILQLSRAALLEYLPASVVVPERTPTEMEEALQAAGEGNAFSPPAEAQLATRAQQAAPLREDTEAAQRKKRESVSTETQELGQSGPSTGSFGASFSTRGQEEAKRIEMPGGGVLLYRRRRDLPLVALNVLLRGGKRGETKTTAGLTSLMLKASLKGTRSYDAEELTNRIEGLGSGIGTTASADYFGYGMKLQREVLQEGFALFAEALTLPTFPPDEVEREKQSIYAEIRRQQDSPPSLAFDLLSRACYGEEHPYGLPSSGSAEAVAAFSRDDLEAWHRKHVAVGNLYVGIVGDIEEAEAEALFANLTSARTGELDLWQEEPVSTRQQEAVVCEEYREKKQTASALGFTTVDLYHEDRFALDILAEIASGMGGRFFRAVRGEHALAYSVSAFHRARVATGNFIMYTSTSPENADLARELLLRECDLLVRDLVREEELATAKASLAGEYSIGTQTFGAQAGELAGIALYGHPLDQSQRYLARIKAVTAEEVRDVARRYLTPDNFCRGTVYGSLPGG
ncbi:MAG TPA: pitrilysin family protein [Chthonomonadaceae bacterium]|nr:pitrilysin family protein [Chthonomonadaceae bacterium]